MDIWKFKIAGYEVGAGVNFQKMLNRKGVHVFEKVRRNMYIFMYPVWYLVNTQHKNKYPPHIGYKY
jgi:hypothetical protein